MKKKLISLVITVLLLANMIPAYSISESAVEYRITSNIKPLETVGLTINGGGNEIILESTGEVSGSRYVCYSFPYNAVNSARCLEIDVSNLSTAGMSLSLYWDNGGGNHIYNMENESAGSLGKISVSLTEAVDAAEDSGILPESLLIRISMIAITSQQIIKINGLRLYNPSIYAETVSDKIIVNESTAQFFNTGVALQPYGEKGLTLTNQTGVINTNNLSVTWKFPAWKIKQSPYFNIDFAESSTAQVTLLAYWGDGSDGYEAAISYGNAAILGDKHFNLSASAEKVLNSAELTLSLYLVDYTGTQKINLNSIYFSSVSPVDEAGVFRLKGTPSADTKNFTDGGYYALGQGISLSETGDRGLAVTYSGGTNSNVIWAFPSAYLEKRPYFIYDPEQTENNETVSITMIIGYGIGTQNMFVYSFTPISTITGEKVINVKELLKDKINSGYVYINLYIISNIRKTVSFKNLYMSDIPSASAGKAESVELFYETFGGEMTSGSPSRTIKDNLFVLGDAERKGYQFIGWTDRYKVYNPYELYIPKETITLYALWKQNGDLDDDGKYAITDLIKMKNMLLSKEGRRGDADVNGDKSVNLLDILELKQKIIDNPPVDGMDIEFPWQASAVIDQFENYNLLEAKGDGIFDNTQVINDSITECVKDGKNPVFPAGIYFINGTVIFPASVSVKMMAGAVIKTAPSAKIIFDSVIEAGNYKIFENSGILKINSVNSGNPFWFGAKGDGVTDDTAAFNMAFQVFNEVGLPYTERGYVISSLSTFSNMSLYGTGSLKSKIKAKNITTNLIYAGTGYFKIKNIEFDMSASPAGSSAVYFDTAASFIEKVYITDCDFYDAYYVFNDAKSTNLMMFMYFERINCYLGRNSTFNIEDFEGFIFFKKVKIDNSASYQKYNLLYGFPAIKIDDVRGTIFEEVEVIGGNSAFTAETGFFIPGQIGTLASIWWDRVTVKNMRGYGIVLGTTYICSFINVTVESCGGGVSVSGSQQLQMEGVTVRNNRAGSNSHGIYLSNCSKSQLSNLAITNNNGRGIYLSGCSSVMTYNAQITGNSSNGYLDTDGGSYNLFMNSSSTGNLASQLTVLSLKGRVDNIVVAEGTAGISFNGSGTR